MAGRPIEIPISVTADGAEKGVSKVADAFDDLEGSLKDVSKAGDKSAKDLKSDMSDAARQLDRDLTKSLDAVADSAKASGKSVGKSMKDGAREAGEATKTFKDESRQNLSESVSSFRGDVEDIPQLLQDVLGGVSADLGAMSGGIAVVGAAAIGITIAALQGQADKINEAKQNVLDLAQAIKDSGGQLSQTDLTKAMDDFGFKIQDDKQWFELMQQDAVSGFEQIRDAAQKAGVGVSDAFKGSFGSLQDATRIQTELQKRIDAVTESQTRQSGMTDEAGQAISYVTDEGEKQLDGLKRLKEQTDKNVKTQQDADEIEKIRRQGIEGTTEALKEDTDALDKNAQATSSSMSSQLDYLDGVDSLNSKIAENGATLDINTKAGRDNARAVLDQAGAIRQVRQDSLDAGEGVDGVNAKFASMKDTLINQVAPAFGGSKEAARQYIEQVLKTPDEAKTTVKLEGVKDVEDKKKGLASPVTVPIVASFQENAFQRILDSMSNRSVPVMLRPTKDPMTP